MSYRLPADALARTYAAMLAPPPPHRASAAERIQREIAAAGWAREWQVEDLLLSADSRLDRWPHAIGIRQFSQALHLSRQTICHRPRSQTNGVTLHEAWQAMDFACLLIVLEMLGFNTDPSVIVGELLPSIPKKGLITNSALDVLWFEKRRHKCTITLSREKDGEPIEDFVRHRLPSGHRVEALLDGDGNPIQLTVHGARYRKPVPIKEVKCADCGDTWYRGDPDSSAAHRKEHRRRMRYLAPEPHELVLAEQRAGTFDEHVDLHSPKWRQQEIYDRAYAFKREEGYDFVQWSQSEDDPNCHGFLFADADGRIVGATAFRLRDYKEDAWRWAMQWVWVAPPFRRRGVLAARWRMFRERFGDFDVEPPVSSSMKDFVEKAGDQTLLAYKRTAISLGSQPIIGLVPPPKAETVTEGDQHAE